MFRGLVAASVMSILACAPAGRNDPGGPQADGGNGDSGMNNLIDGGSSDGGSCAPAYATCNSVPQFGDPITIMQIAADRPAANGGSPISGTYRLTALNLYTGSSGKSGPGISTSGTISLAV